LGEDINEQAAVDPSFQLRLHTGIEVDGLSRTLHVRNQAPNKFDINQIETRNISLAFAGCHTA